MGDRFRVIDGVGVLGCRNSHRLRLAPGRGGERKARLVDRHIRTARGVDGDGDRRRRLAVQDDRVGLGVPLSNRQGGRRDGDSGPVVVRDRNRGGVSRLRVTARDAGVDGDPGGQHRAEAHLDALAVIVDGVLGRIERERQLGVAAVEGDGGGHVGVVGAGGAALLRGGERNLHSPLRVRAQRDRDIDAFALGHRVARGSESHRNLRIVVVGNRHRGRVGSADAYGRRQRGANGELHAFPVVVHGIVGGAEPERLLRLAAGERHVGRDTRVVRARRPTLVRHRQRNYHRPLRVRAEGDADNRLVFGHVHGIRIIAFGHGVAVGRKTDGDGRHVIVGDRHRGRRGTAGTHARGQVPERQPHRLAVVVHRVVKRREREGLRGVAAHERHAGRHPRVVAAARPALVGRRQRDLHRPLRVRAQPHRHRDVVALRHRIGRLSEAHRHRRIVVVGDRHRRRRVRPRGHRVGQPPEAQPHRLAVVVQRVVGRTEREGLFRVAALEGQGGRHAGVVPA